MPQVTPAVLLALAKRLAEFNDRRVDRSPFLTEVELTLRALAAPQAPALDQEALETVAGLIEVVLRGMRAKLGPSWPPNGLSGQQVAEWRDILSPIPAALRAAPRAPTAQETD